jgi:hypothetical protein
MPRRYDVIIKGSCRMVTFRNHNIYDYMVLKGGSRNLYIRRAKNV